MKKVLITGAGGFIGRHAVPCLLKKNYEVHAPFIGPKPDLKPDRNLIWHKCDLLDPAARKKLCAGVKASHLLHFAWYTAPGKYWTSPENLRWAQASIGLIADFAENGGKRAVMAGTCAEYDWASGVCSEEKTPLKPRLLYGTCKNSLRQILDEFSRQTGLSSAWGRIFFLYGPHEQPDRLIPGIILSLLRNRPALCRQGGQVRDFLHVRDVASAFVALLESKVSGPVNIASGRPVALKDVVNLIADKLDRRELVRFGKSADPSAPGVLTADIKRLSREVGWRPAYSLEKGLGESIEWWRTRGKFNES